MAGPLQWPWAPVSLGLSGEAREAPTGPLPEPARDWGPGGPGGAGSHPAGAAVSRGRFPATQSGPLLILCGFFLEILFMDLNVKINAVPLNCKF